MVNREFWIRKIESSWKKRSVIWLSGVRRAGKTCLCQSLKDIEYFDCELPRVRALMDDPEGFLDSVRGKRIVLDEVHRLANPSELLKIAADHYPKTGIIATGSSLLGASAKFRDTLTGRKSEVWLVPMMSEDLRNFGRPDWNHRFLFGGLPPFFMSDEFPERDIQEWADAYWAKDVQELFRLGKRYSFQKFFELLMAQSGGIFEATRFAGPCEVSRATINNYLKILEATYVVHVVRPFSRRRATEIVAAPKVYGFDTGFFCYFRGWREIRPDDMGPLWEHFVLNEIHAHLQTRPICYWRDKRGHEIDFVFPREGKPCIAVECKWKGAEFDARNLEAFLRQYPQSEAYVVSHDAARTISRVILGTKVHFVNLSSLIDAIAPGRQHRQSPG
ncbi:MAG: ATP-binding protein [Candidatus Omnitrophica bacterium]|nr:ATP-binding protein [Candidatus Omnitrophota bacterium]